MGVAKGLENKIRFLGRIEHACGATVKGCAELVVGLQPFVSVRVTESPYPWDETSTTSTVKGVVILLQERKPTVCHF